MDGKWPEYTNLRDNLCTYLSNLRHLNISGFNNSNEIRGDNKIIAILIAKSTHLKSLDMTASKLTLLSTIATTLPWGHLLTSLNLSVVGNNNLHNFLLRYETIKKIDTYICTYLATSIEKVNLATERVRRLIPRPSGRGYLNTCRDKLNDHIYTSRRQHYQPRAYS